MWKRQGMLFGMVVGGLLLTIIAVWMIADLFHVLAQTKGTDRTALRNIGIVVAGLGAVVFGIWRARIAEEQTAVARDQYARSLDRDYADLFTKAVEQLGTDKIVKQTLLDAEGNPVIENGRAVMEEVTKPNIEVRLGAIYALERISRESERDHIAVMETLCAYVRENAPAAGLEDFSDYDLSLFDESSDFGSLRSDIQSTVAVIGRRSGERISYELSHLSKNRIFRIDLREVNLRGGDLRHMDLSYARLTGARLEGSLMYGTNLKSAHLWKAHLERVDIRKANFEKADLIDTKLNYARVENTSFKECNASLGRFTDIDDLEALNLREMFGCFGTVIPTQIETFKPIHWHPDLLNGWIERTKAYNAWKAARAFGERPPWVDEADWSGWGDTS